jgi:hypothetical protein
MTVIDRIKEQQREEEIEKLSVLCNAKLSALSLELDLAKRNIRLTNDESTRIVMSSFYAFAAELAVEEGHVREDFLRMMAETFDDALEEIADEEEEDDVEASGSDKGATEEGPAGPAGPGPIVVS